VVVAVPRVATAYGMPYWAVHVALDDQQPRRPPVGLERFVQAVELASLVEDRALRGVQVLGFAVAEHAAAEADHTPAAIPDREDHPVAEAVVAPAVVAPHQ
jgi:hypothetical protein